MRRAVHALVASLLPVLVACASPRPEVVGAPFGQEPAITASLGRVYVYRTGSGRSDESIGVDGTKVGTIRYDSSIRGTYCEFLFADLAPGTHHLSTEYQGALEPIGLQLDVRAGEQYFVRVDAGSSALGGPTASADVLTNQMTESYHRIELASQASAPHSIRSCFQTLALPNAVPSRVGSPRTATESP
jgi:hypothetical protein